MVGQQLFEAVREGRYSTAGQFAQTAFRGPSKPREALWGFWTEVDPISWTKNRRFLDGAAG